MSSEYRIPGGTHRVEIVVDKSRFIATAGFAERIEEAKAFLERVRQEMPDASHHVYAYRVGYGNSVTEGMSDDGEPSGTSGPPALAVLRGQDLGDVIVVITRYFGGRKLGKGGLVRAYSDAVREVLAHLPTTLKVEVQTLATTLPYANYEAVKGLVTDHAGVVQDEAFGADVQMTVVLPVSQLERFHVAVREATLGRVQFAPSQADRH